MRTWLFFKKNNQKESKEIMTKDIVPNPKDLAETGPSIVKKDEDEEIENVDPEQSVSEKEHSEELHTHEIMHAQ